MAGTETAYKARAGLHLTKEHRSPSNARSRHRHSTYPAERIVEAQSAAAEHGYRRFRAEQPQYRVPGRSHGLLDSCWLIGEISAGSEDSVWKSCDRDRTRQLFATRHDKEERCPCAPSPPAMVRKSSTRTEAQRSQWCSGTAGRCTPTPGTIRPGGCRGRDDDDYRSADRSGRRPARHGPRHPVRLDLWPVRREVP